MLEAKWKRGFEGLHKGDANKIASEIMEIGETATPQQIVLKAQAQETELHKEFEWDNEVAGAEYRIIQARELVRHLVVVEQTISADRPEIRFFFKPEKTQGYKPTEFIVQRRDEYAELLAQARRELQAFRDKYSRLTELSEVFIAIEDVI